MVENGLSTGAEEPFGHPRLRRTSTSHHTLTGKLAQNATAMKYPSKKHVTLSQESDVCAASSARGASNVCLLHTRARILIFVISDFVCVPVRSEHAGYMEWLRV